MNREYRRRVMREAKRIKNQRDEDKGENEDRDPQATLDAMSMPQLVSGINNLLSQLESRGVQVRDWDDNERRLCRVQVKQGGAYYLAVREDDIDKA